MLTSSVAVQCFKTITWRNAKIFEIGADVQGVELALCDGLQRCRAYLPCRLSRRCLRFERGVEIVSAAAVSVPSVTLRSRLQWSFSSWMHEAYGRRPSDARRRLAEVADRQTGGANTAAELTGRRSSTKFGLLTGAITCRSPVSLACCAMT